MGKSCVHELENSNTPQSDLKSQRQSYQNPNGLVCKNGKDGPKIHMELQEFLNSQKILKNEEQTWRTHTSHFKTYYKAIVIKQCGPGIGIAVQINGPELTVH